MRRADFDRLYLDQFPILVASIQRKGYEDGADACQATYLAVLLSQCYREVSRGKDKGQQWLKNRVWKQVKQQNRERRQTLSLHEEGI